MHGVPQSSLPRKRPQGNTQTPAGQRIRVFSDRTSRAVPNRVLDTLLGNGQCGELILNDEYRKNDTCARNLPPVVSTYVSTGFVLGLPIPP
jgi:hypothetical protein